MRNFRKKRALFVERAMSRKNISSVLSEELDKYETKAQIIKALNALDKISETITQAQFEEYVHPAVEKLLELKDEIQ